MYYIQDAVFVLLRQVVCYVITYLLQGLILIWLQGKISLYAARGTTVMKLICIIASNLFFKF